MACVFEQQLDTLVVKTIASLVFRDKSYFFHQDTWQVEMFGFDELKKLVHMHLLTGKVAPYGKDHHTFPLDFMFAKCKRNKALITLGNIVKLRALKNESVENGGGLLKIGWGVGLDNISAYAGNEGVLYEDLGGGGGGAPPPQEDPPSAPLKGPLARPQGAPLWGRGPFRGGAGEGGSFGGGSGEVLSDGDAVIAHHYNNNEDNLELEGSFENADSDKDPVIAVDPRKRSRQTKIPSASNSQNCPGVDKGKALAESGSDTRAKVGVNSKAGIRKSNSRVDKGKALAEPGSDTKTKVGVNSKADIRKAGIRKSRGSPRDSTSAASGAALFPASQQGQGSVLRLSCSKAAKDARTSTPTQKKTKLDKSEPHPSKSAGGHKMQFSDLSDEQLHHYQVCQIHAARCSTFMRCGVFYVDKTTPHRPPQLTHTKHTLVHTHKKPTHRPCFRIHAHIHSHAKTHTHAHTHGPCVRIHAHTHTHTRVHAQEAMYKTESV